MNTPLYWKEGMIYSEEGQTLATMDSENKSLGLMFAAAPELLEALKRLISSKTLSLVSASGINRVKSYQVSVEAIKQCEAAIAKAEKGGNENV